MENNELKINTILQTKDGRNFGNGIVIGTRENYYLIKSDYGNEIRFNEDEINEYFYIGPVADSTHKYFSFPYNNFAGLNIPFEIGVTSEFIKSIKVLKSAMEKERIIVVSSRNFPHSLNCQLSEPILKLDIKNFNIPFPEVDITKPDEHPDKLRSGTTQKKFRKSNCRKRNKFRK
jgi:hypothetical protein